MPQAQNDSFKLEQFGGCLPAWDDQLLPQGQSAFSQNGYLFSGALLGWRQPKLLRTLTNSAAKMVYRLPTTISNVAQATLYVLSQPNAGDTVSLGEEVYTFTATVNNAYDVKIGGTADASGANLFAAFTGDNEKYTSQGTLYGTGTVVNPAINQATPNTNQFVSPNARLVMMAPTYGAAFNSTLVADSTSGARLAWRFNNVATTTFQGGSNKSFDASITGASAWLEFIDPDTDIMRSPVVDDQFDRYYFASPSLAPQYNTRDRIAAGSAPWLLGVPSPGCLPGVTVAGGGSSATLGFPNANTGAVGIPGANIIYLVPITPTGAMLLNDVTALPQGDSATGNFAAVLYSDLNGSPHQLMNTGAPVVGLSTGGQISSAFINPTGLLVNVQYWIGFMCDVAVAFQEADTTGSKGVVCLNTYSNGPPAVINNLSTGYPDLQVWGDLTTSSLQEARSYVYTYVSAYDEESAPSPATVVTGWANGTWTIDLFEPPPDQLGVTRNLTLTRVYRSITASSGATTYFFVAELPIAQATYVDVITDDALAMQRQLTSQLWTPPPENLQGILSMPNGMAVGFAGNEIWFCEPYRPHAWPASYVVTTEHPIVGLGVTGSSVVACTSGTPYVATGVSPGSMSMTKTQTTEPCLSRRSVLGNTDGVYYCSPNGLILVDQNGAVKNTTELWITRERWQQLVPQKFIRAVFLVSSYFAMGTTFGGDTSVAKQGFTIELNSADSQSFTIWPQPGGHRLGFNLLSAPNGFNVDNVEIDPWSSVCILVQNSAIYYYDFSDPAPAMVPFKWRSKQFQQKSKKNFEVVRVIFSVPTNTPAQGTRNTAATADPSWATLGANQYGILRVYADGNLVTVRELYNTNEVLRILSGFKYEIWQFEIEARVVISTLQVGTSLRALAKV